MISVSETTDLVKAFNWQSPSWDLFIFLFWLVVSVFYTFAAGRGRIINILVSVYMAKLLTLEAPFMSAAIKASLPESLLALQQLIVFAVLFLLLFTFMGRYVFKTSADHRKMASMVYGLVFSVLQIGLLINTILSLLPPDVKNSFSPLIQTLFIKGPAPFIWLIVPLVYLVLLGRHISHHDEF